MHLERKLRVAHHHSEDTVLERFELANASVGILASLALIGACSSEPGAPANSGGAPNTGTGGASGAATGGIATGGIASTGGTSGGTVSSGGTTGGMVSSGGTTGGMVSSGGTTGGTATGGTTAGGGAPSGGLSSAGAGGSAGGGVGTAGAATGGASAGAPSGGAGTSGGSGGGSGAFTLTSPNHVEGAKFASKYTCADAGFDKSLLPELNWTAGPAGTKSYAITFIDTTLAPANMNGYHWVVYDIPATVRALPESMRDASTVGAKQSGAFLGPCPNFMSSGALKTDNYEFTLYALASETSTFASGGVTVITKDAQTKLEASNLASAKLKGTSDAKWPK